MNDCNYFRRSIAHRRAPGWLALLTATVLAPVEALAASEISERVALGSFRGPHAARVRDAVEGALLRRYYLVPESMVTEAARQSGGGLRSDEDFAAVGKTLNVKAFVSATVSKQKGWQVEMMIRQGATGQPIGRFAWSDRRINDLAASLARSTPQRLRAVMSDGIVARQADAPAAVVSSAREADAPEAVVSSSPRKGPPPAKKEDDDDDSEGDSDPVSHAGTIPYFELGLGGRVFNRSLSYRDNVSGLPGYKLSGASGAAIEAALNLFAGFRQTAGTWQAGLGLTVNFNYGLAVGSTVNGGAGSSPTNVFGYELGLRDQIGVGSGFVIPHVGYVVDSFSANIAGANSPDVSYHSLRVGLGVRLTPTSHTSIRASVDYLDVLSAGALNGDDRFPRATVQGLDLSLGGAYQFAESFEVQLQGSLRRYGIDTKVTPADPLVVGGAIDQYLSMTMGVTYRPALTGGH